jgi:tRNA pseudouridine synthase 10
MSIEKINENILDIARSILELGPICNNCLGRQFAMLSTGLTNNDRGLAIKTVLAMEGSRSENKEILELLASCFRSSRLSLGIWEVDDARCWVCLGEMKSANLMKWAEKAVQSLQNWEYDSFLVGTKISGLLAENEELLLIDGCSKHAEPFKSELNREVGKLIAFKTGKRVDFQGPDALVHLNLETGEVELQISAIYIYGRYKKLIRGIPQTRWPCRHCKGLGCEGCNGTGKMYQESVDELIRPEIIKAAQADDIVFHGAGREDIDARMLGNGRPFIVEALRPKVRNFDLTKLQEAINKRTRGKVEVQGLVRTKAKHVEYLKEAAYQKTYSAKVEFGSEIEEEKLKSILKELIGSVNQRTPTRVAHRRADKVRVRKVYTIDLIDFTGQTARLVIRGDSGLYIKELVSGDGGRTRPSLADALGIDAIVSELDVIDVGGEVNGTLSWNAKENKAQAEQNSQN